jgi:hypothetical protein
MDDERRARSARDLARAADRIESLADTAELMGDDDGAGPAPGRGLPTAALRHGFARRRRLRKAGSQRTSVTHARSWRASGCAVSGGGYRLARPPRERHKTIGRQEWERIHD